MPGRPEHLTEREFRLLAYIEELGRAQDKMREQVRRKFADAADLNIGVHVGASRALHHLARRIRKNNIPGWE